MQDKQDKGEGKTRKEVSEEEDDDLDHTISFQNDIIVNQVYLSIYLPNASVVTVTVTVTISNAISILFVWLFGHRMREMNGMYMCIYMHMFLCLSLCVCTDVRIFLRSPFCLTE